MGNESEQWTVENIGSQEGRVAIVTGANSGLGYYTSKALAMKGARVIMACRNSSRGEEARSRILEEGPTIDPEVWSLDLASMESIQAFTRSFISSNERLDLLINNAGLMAIPYHRTMEGFEMQFGVNHLGHFALSMHLWPLISATPESRIVNVSSAAHHFGKIRFEDIHWERSYSKWGAYGMSKLANLLFTRELSKKLKAAGSSVKVAAAHPGYADTELQAKGAKMKGSRIGAGSFNLVNRLVAQPAFMGALPSLYAATAEDVEQGGYYGPDGFMRMKGWPAPDRPNPKRMDDEVAGKLWVLSELLTGVKFPL